MEKLSMAVGVQGVDVLILLGALFLTSVAPASQQGFIHGAHTVCFCNLFAILDPPHFFSIVVLRVYCGFYKGSYNIS
jgi:hypothetical protein